MKAVLQRVAQASVTVDGKVVGQIGGGLLILLGVERGDQDKDCVFIARKCVDMRIFADNEGKMNRSVLDTGGAILLVSQFTLAAEWKKGRRPSFIGAAEPAEGNRLYELFAAELQKLGVKVQTGVFGAHMDVALINDGPVTIIIDHQLAVEA